MKGSRTTITEELYNYINDIYVKESDFLKSIDSYYEKEKIKKISITPEQGKLLYLISKMINAKNILEIGTLIGYSTVWLADSLPSNGAIYTIEISEKHYSIARDIFNKYDHKEKIKLIHGNALNIIDTIKNTIPFDLIFIDAGKDLYPIFYNKLIKYLRRGGVIAFDNALSKGRILDNDNNEKGVIGVRELNELMGTSDKIDSILIPIADGIAIGLKK